jgi:hypothetical protein
MTDKVLENLRSRVEKLEKEVFRCSVCSGTGEDFNWKALLYTPCGNCTEDTTPTEEVNSWLRKFRGNQLQIVETLIEGLSIGEILHTKEELNRLVVKLSKFNEEEPLLEYACGGDSRVRSNKKRNASLEKLTGTRRYGTSK